MPLIIFCCIGKILVWKKSGNEWYILILLPFQILLADVSLIKITKSEVKCSLYVFFIPKECLCVFHRNSFIPSMSLAFHLPITFYRVNFSTFLFLKELFYLKKFICKDP